MHLKRGRWYFDWTRLRDTGDKGTEDGDTRRVRTAAAIIRFATTSSNPSQAIDSDSISTEICLTVSSKNEICRSLGPNGKH